MEIDDLNDEMLREILCRLPCYRTALQCKAVSKRWCSIISNPLFITQAFLTHRKIKEEKPSSVFLLTMKSSAMWDDKFVAPMVAPPCFQRTLSSPFLSLQFLPHQSTLVATFKDLILSYTVDPWTGLHLYYICNPLTKQWMVLPASQAHQKQVIWAALTYLDGHSFRVVAAHCYPNVSSGKDYHFIMINLLIYISETCEWRNIDVRLQLKPSNDGYYDGKCFTGVVCKGMVCIHYGKYFGAFNPFNVTGTCYGTLTAIDLPSRTGNVAILLESDGNLVAFEEYHYITLRLVQDDTSNYFLTRTRIWKLDMRLNNNNNNDDDKQLRQWELLSQYDDRIDIKKSMLSSDRFWYGFHKFKVVGVHPSKEHLVYITKEEGSSVQTSLILFDTKSKSLEHLTKTIPPHRDVLTPTSLKLDIPCWPTPIPISQSCVVDNCEGE